MPLPPGGLDEAPNLLLQKFPASEFSVGTRIEIPADSCGTRAGLIVTGETCVALDVRNDAGTYHIRLERSGETLGDMQRAAGPVDLHLRVAEGGICQLGVVGDDDGFSQIGPSFHATPGKWIGAKVGIYCVTTSDAGHADFEWFRFTPFRSADEVRRSRPAQREVPREAVPTRTPDPSRVRAK